MRDLSMHGRAVAATVTALLAVVGAGCGSDSDSASSDGAASGTAPAPNTDQSAERSVQIASEYTGGTPGKADPSREEVGIGWVSQEQGVVALPGIDRTVRAAVRFLNEELGGVGGHAVKIIQPAPCKLANEQDGTLCAQALLNDPSVDVILSNASTVGGRPFFAKALNNDRVPVVSPVPLSPDNVTAKNAYFINGGPLTLPVTAKFLATDLKARSTAQVWPDDPSFTSFAQGFVKLLEGMGMKATLASIPPGAPDVTSAIAAAQPQKNDVTYIQAFTTSQCIAVAKALKSLQVTKPVVGNSTCLDPSVKEQLGDFPKWIYLYNEPNPQIEDPSGVVGAEVYALKKYDPDNWQADIQTFQSQNYFGLVLTIAKWMNDLGGPDKMSLKSFDQAAKAFKGPMWAGAPKLEFGKQPTPALGANTLIYPEYLGDGKWKYRSDGWVTAPRPAA